MTRLLARFAVVFGLLCSAVAASAQPLSPAERDRIDAVLADTIGEGDPGFAVGVVRGQEVVFEHYAGLADLTHSVLIGPQTRFNIASNAKQFVALMALSLADQGRIDLDADFRTYLPDALPSIEQEITVRQLITHTSGVRDIYELWSLQGITWYERPFQQSDATALLNRQSELNFASGSAHLYSNSNYILLADLIAAVTGERFDTFAGAFFDQLAMPHTRWKGRAGEVLAGEARAYGDWDGWFEYPSNVNLFGDGFLYSTLRDQMAWESQIQGAPSALGGEIIRASQQPPGDLVSGGYGFGLEHGMIAGSPGQWHAGSTGAFNSYLIRLPEREIAVVALGNTAQVSIAGLAQRIAAALLDIDVANLRQYPAGPDRILERPQAAEIAGLYKTEQGTFIRIRETPDGLVREIEGRDPVGLIHEEGNVFAYATVPDLKIVFDRSDTGQKRFRLFLPSQPVTTALEIAPLPAGNEPRASLEGCFLNVETDTRIAIAWKGDDAFTMTKNGRSRDAQMVGADYLVWNGYNLRFQRGEDGAVSGLLVDNDRIRNVRFNRSETCEA